MIESFIKAFKANHSGFQGTCNCGREFFNPDSVAWDFEDDEIEFFNKDDNTTELNVPVQYNEFIDREYVINCDCWQQNEKRFMEMMDSHDAQIAKYLNTERERKIFEAERVQIIEVLDRKPEPEFDDDIPF